MYSGDITRKLPFVSLFNVVIRASQELNYIIPSQELVIHLSTDVKNHRMGAYIYGFLSGVGLILIIWGLASIAILPSGYLMMNIGLTLFGFAVFACGSCREAYLRGNLSVPSKVYTHTKRNRRETANLTSEQIIENPAEVESQKTHAS